MPVRIAFTACSKFNFDSEQRVWLEIEEHRPQHLMLLGDQIYMDFRGDGGESAGDFIGYELGEPGQASVSLAEFEFQMRLRYRQQFSVASFRALVHAIGARGGSVEMVWDDHDFGFNNALGLSGGPSDDEFAEYLMPADKKLASRRLFEEFRWNVGRLRVDPAAQYEVLPGQLAALADPYRGVQWHVPLAFADVFLLDTRSFRQSPPRKKQGPDSSILGNAQWDWLRNALLASDKRLAIVAAGSPLSSPGLASDQSWKQRKRRPYREHGLLLELAAQLQAQGKQLLFIGGDRHTVDKIEDEPALPEFVCAGAAAPKGLFLNSNGRHFCLVDVHEPGRAAVRLFTRGEEKEAWPEGTELRFPSAETATAAQGLVHSLGEGQGKAHVHAQAHAQSPTAPLLFSDLFLITDREFDDEEPTDDPDTRLHCFHFSGDRMQGKASRLKNWKPLDSDAFWTAVRTSLVRLQQLNPDNPSHIGVFVPGNRESNDTAIAQYRALNEIAFNAQGGGCIGVCIVFDWASRMGAFALKEIYRENIERAEAASAWLEKILQSASTACREHHAQLSLVAHSLGNRVALPALARLPADTVDRYYANAADLGRNVFDSEAGQAALRASRSVLVPYTGSDFAMSHAESADPDTGPRLGRVGPSLPLPDRVHAKDTSGLVSRVDPHGCLLWHPWPDEDAGGLQQAFYRALVAGDWR